MRLVHFVGMVVVLAALAAGVALPRTAHAQTLTIEPPVAPPGTEFVVEGEGFAPNELIAVWINTPDGSVIQIIDPKGRVFVARADGDGNARWFVTLSDDADPGFYSMVAHGISSEREAVIPFQIDPNAGPPPGTVPPADSTATVEPPAGSPNTEFEFYADGFDANESVGVWINAPDGSVIRVTDAEGDTFVVRANSEGAARWFVTLASDAEPGLYTMVAEGIESGIVHVIPFEITIA